MPEELLPALGSVKGGSESAVQVPAVSCISWDGFKRKVTGFPPSPRGLFSLLAEDFGGANGNYGPSSLSFLMGFGYLIVLGALENAPLLHGVTF